MSNAASFNLLAFVERRPMLSAAKIMCIVAFCTIAMMVYFLFQVDHFRSDAENSSKIELTIQQLIQTLQPSLQQGTNNPMIGVLSSGGVPHGAQGFYPEFEALTHIQIKGLWLERVEIQRYPASIKITGAMNSPDQLDELLKQLALQPAFKNIHFVGVDVNKGLLPDVPKKYQAELKQVKIPDFYRFTLQTSPLIKSRTSL